MLFVIVISNSTQLRQEYQNNNFLKKNFQINCVFGWISILSAVTSTDRNYRVMEYYYGYEYLDENRNRWYQYPDCGAMRAVDSDCHSGGLMSVD